MPTVYALWRLPPFMPSLYIHPATLRFLSRGADLMLPGVFLPPDGIDLLAKRPMAVVFTGSNVPVAVGYPPVTDTITTMAQMKGKALIIQHLFGDELWASGSKQQIDDALLSRFSTNTTLDIEEALADMEAAQLDVEQIDDKRVEDQSAALSAATLDPEAASSSAPSSRSVEESIKPEEQTDDEVLNLTPEQMDLLVMTSFLQAIKKRMKDKDLPMLASKFWAELCLPSRPRGTMIDWKRTSWKKLLPFLEEQARIGMISINTTEQGVTSLVAIIRDHPTLEAFRTMNHNETAQADIDLENAVEEDDSKPIIQEFWTLHKRLEFLLVVLEEDDAPSEESENLLDLDLLSTHLKGGSDRTKFFTKPQITALLWQYVTLRKLGDEKDPKKVTLDMNLSAALYPGGKVKSGDSVAKKELAELFNAKIIPIQVVKVNGEVRVEKGAQVGNVSVIVEARGGSKLITRVQGLHHFGLDFKELSKRASKKFASSAGQALDLQGHDELLLQGNLEKSFPAFLTQEYNIPTKHIKVEVKGNVKKKR